LIQVAIHLHWLPRDLAALPIVVSTLLQVHFQFGPPLGHP